jgi:hypothetical protein
VSLLSGEDGTPEVAAHVHRNPPLVFNTELFSRQPKGLEQGLIHEMLLDRVSVGDALSTYWLSSASISRRISSMWFRKVLCVSPSRKGRSELGITAPICPKLDYHLQTLPYAAG